MSKYKLIRPTREADRLHDDVERYLGGGREKRAIGHAAAHSLSLGEDQENFYVEALTAGLNADSLSVVITDGQLKATGTRPALDPAHTVLRQEREVGDFSFEMRVPALVDAEKITADYRRGILLISFPKADAAKSRTVPVTVQ